MNYELHGTLRLEQGADILPDDFKVELYRSNLQGQQKVGESIPKRDGSFRIEYDTDDEAPDIRIIVIDAYTNAKALTYSGFDVQPKENVSLTIPAARVRTPTEYEGLGRAIQKFASGKNTTALTREQQTYVAKKAQLSPRRIGMYVEAQDLERQTKVPASIHYGLLRQGIPAKAEALLPLTPQKVRSNITLAVNDKIIPEPTSAQLEQADEKLKEFVANDALENASDGKASLSDVLAIGKVPKATSQKFIRMYYEHDELPQRFWEKLAKDKTFQTGGMAQRIRFLIEAYNLTHKHLPLLKQLYALRSAKKIGSVKDLAVWSAKDWKPYLAKTKGGVPHGTPGATFAEQQQNYIAQLRGTLHRAYPSHTVLSRVQTSKKDADLTAFLRYNPAFDLGATRLDAYLKDHPNAFKGVKDKEALVKKLAALQRQYVVAGGRQKPEAMIALQTMGTLSSHDIARMGWSNFRERFTAGGGNPEDAHGIYMQAMTQVTAGQMLLTQISPALQVNTYAFSTPQPSQTPDWGSLFGDGKSYCACEHCMSVYSPAAYLTDLFQFMDGIQVVEKTSAGTTKPSTLLRQLLRRRPDLQYIELNCANTHTELPYIDLVIEILETLIVYRNQNGSPAQIEKFESLQTTLSSKEIQALPQHREDVYSTTLANGVYPWTLPFELWTEEGRLYLEQLGVSRLELIEQFSNAEYTATIKSEAWVNETLRLHPKTRELILNQLGVSTEAFWGMQNLQYKALENVPVLLQQGNLTFDELRELADTWFLNRSHRMDIVLREDDPCNLDKATIKNSFSPKKSLWDKMGYFLRLRQVIGWSISDLDRALQAFGKTSINTDALTKIAHLRSITTTLNLTVAEALTFWADIDTKDREKEPSLYATTFLNQSVLNPGADGLQVQSGPTAELTGHNDKLTDNLPALAAALNITAAQIGEILAAHEADDKLTLANVSLLYRYTLLARSLGFSVSNLIDLERLSGKKPFDADTSELLDFIRLADFVRSSDFSIEDLTYLLFQTPQANAEAGAAKAQAFLENLGADLTRLYRDIRGEGLHQDVLVQQVQQLLPAKDAEIVWEVISATSALAKSEQRDILHNAFGFLTAAYDDDLIATILAAGAEKRIELLWRAIVRHNYLVQGGALIVENFAAEFAIEPGICRFLLKKYLSVPRSKEQWAYEFILLDALDRDSFAIDEAPELHEIFIRLEKLAFTLNTWGFQAPDQYFLFRGGIDAEETLAAGQQWAGFLDYRRLPGSSNGAAPSPAMIHTWFNEWVRVEKLRRLSNGLQGQITAFELFRSLHELRKSGGTLPAEELWDYVHAATGWNPRDLAYLSATQQFSLDDFTDERLLFRLTPLFASLNITDASAADAQSWIAPTLNSDSADNIRQKLKARYESGAWLDKAAALRDPLRKAQRDALLAYVAGEIVEPDENELYAALLIDIHMDPCMLTSRIKQAISSAQLFVQRALLNLENGSFTINAESLPALDHWQYYKNYRVWEANRKVFLYPENWAEASLWTGKTPFFKELENELLQGGLTQENLEKAYIHYLEKLETVSQLDIRATYRSAEDFYVFGRTKEQPHTYYFRKRSVGKNTWSPWEKIDLDIEGEHLIPYVYEGRLYLMWPIFTPLSNTKEIDIGEKLREALDIQQIFTKTRLAWADYKHGKWSLQKTTDNLSNIFDGVSLLGYNLHIDDRFWDFGNDVINSLLLSKRSHFFFTVSYAPEGFVIDVYTGGFSDSVETDHPVFTENTGIRLGEFRFTDGKFIVKRKQWKTENIPGGQFGIANLEYNQYRLERSRYNNHGLVNAPLDINNQRLMEHAPDGGYTLTPSFNGAQPMHIGVPIIYQDAQRTFLAESSNGLQYRMQGFYHPFADKMASMINMQGISSVFEADGFARQLLVETFFDEYEPHGFYLETPHPDNRFNFNLDDPNAQYNWELFYFIPMLIADKLSKDQQFEAAQKWYHYVFDPTSADAYPAPEKFWKTQPLFDMAGLAQTPQNIADILKILRGDVVLAYSMLEATFKQAASWYLRPLDPHAIAIFRWGAYQKHAVMKYLDNLIAWADHLFRRDSIESINEASQLYILALDLLGKKPEQISLPLSTSKHYKELREAGLDIFSNAVVELEETLMHVLFESASANGSENTQLGSIEFDPAENGQSTNPTGFYRRLPEPPLGTLMVIDPLNIPYFCLPPNEKLLGYWDTLADRLFKIRHCQNIEGIERKLSLFEPPIDPAILVRAQAHGLDIGAVLDMQSEPLPHYRFATMIQVAKNFCQNVRDYGRQLQAALEKKDAEGLAMLRAENVTEFQKALRQIRDSQIQEAQKNIRSLEAGKRIAEARHAHFEKIEKESSGEREYLKNLEKSSRKYAESSNQEKNASDWFLEGEFTYANTFGSENSNTIGASLGGRYQASALDLKASSYTNEASESSVEATKVATTAGYQRRWAEWKLQERLAAKEVAAIDTQIQTAEIRVEILQKESEQQQLAYEQAQADFEYLKGRFTHADLYDWMLGELSSLHFQGYRLALTIAQKSQKCFYYETGDESQQFIQHHYWDSLKKGLLAGEKLLHDLQRMEAAYLELNRREFELTKHISLASLNAPALETLRETGVCYVDFPEYAFDLDYPGHYMRRIKGLSVSIPCVVGPFTQINCKVVQLKNSVRISAETQGEYARQDEDARFRGSFSAGDSIATSNGQNDSGTFEFNFRDERYLPFEGTGAVSQWRLELPDEFRQFDYRTITDVIFHLRYSARDGGESLKTAAAGHVSALLRNLTQDSKAPLHKSLSLRHDYGDEWRRYFHTPLSDDNAPMTLALDNNRYPYLFHTKDKNIVKLEFHILLAHDVRNVNAMEVQVALPDSAAPQAVSLTREGQILTGSLSANSNAVGAMTLRVSAGSVAADLKKTDTSGEYLDDTKVKDIRIVAHYVLG